MRRDRPRRIPASTAGVRIRRVDGSLLLDGRIAADEYFFAEQNARLVRNAEEYYRSMFAGRVLSWNLRDTHMMETLEALLAHVRQTSGEARAVIWAHNSHLGDARATYMVTPERLAPICAYPSARRAS